MPKGPLSPEKKVEIFEALEGRLHKHIYTYTYVLNIYIYSPEEKVEIFEALEGLIYMYIYMFIYMYIYMFILGLLPRGSKNRVIM